MENAVVNCNGKIWVFQNEDIEGAIRDEDEQQITCDFKYNEAPNNFTLTFIFAKFKDHLRRPLRDKLIKQDNGSDNPWCTAGDFNVITTRRGKRRRVT